MQKTTGKLKRLVGKRETSQTRSLGIERDSDLSAGERSVLSLFRNFRMSPGRMLCLCKPDTERFSRSLISLIERQLLQAERYTGGYSLTPAGYLEIRSGAATAKKPR